MAVVNSSMRRLCSSRQAHNSVCADAVVAWFLSRLGLPDVHGHLFFRECTLHITLQFVSSPPHYCLTTERKNPFHHSLCLARHCELDLSNSFFRHFNLERSWRFVTFCISVSSILHLLASRPHGIARTLLWINVSEGIFHASMKVGKAFSVYPVA